MKTKQVVHVLNAFPLLTSTEPFKINPPRARPKYSHDFNKNPINYVNNFNREHIVEYWNSNCESRNKCSVHIEGNKLFLHKIKCIFYVCLIWDCMLIRNIASSEFEQLLIDVCLTKKTFYVDVLKNRIFDLWLWKALIIVDRKLCGTSQESKKIER